MALCVWATKKQYASKMSVAEMKMLRWMCDTTLRDKNRNENLRTMVGVERKKTRREGID